MKGKECIHVTMYLCYNVPMLQYTYVTMYLCYNVPILQCTYVTKQMSTTMNITGSVSTHSVWCKTYDI